MEIELAEEMQRRVPSLERIRFCNSGTEAVMNAIRAAIAFTGKQKIARFEGAYNGTSDHALVSLAPPIGPEAGPAERPCPIRSSVGLSSAADDVIILPFNNAAACQALIEEHAADLAAVVLDPLMTNAGVIVPEDHFLQTDSGRHGVAGRPARIDEDHRLPDRPRWRPAGSWDYAGLTRLRQDHRRGMAGGAFGGRADIMRPYDPTRSGAKIPQAGTFNANPLMLTAGLTTLRLLTPDVYMRMASMARRVRDELGGRVQGGWVPGLRKRCWLNLPALLDARAAAKLPGDRAGRQIGATPASVLAPQPRYPLAAGRLHLSGHRGRAPESTDRRSTHYGSRSLEDVTYLHGLCLKAGGRRICLEETARVLCAFSVPRFVRTMVPLIRLGSLPGARSPTPVDQLDSSVFRVRERLPDLLVGCWRSFRSTLVTRVSRDHE